MKKFKDFFNEQRELLIGVISLLVYVAFYYLGMWLQWPIFPLGYVQKIAFGTFGMSVISSITWFWLGAIAPHFKELIDPEKQRYKMLSQWEQTKLAFWFYAFYAGGAVLLASLF